MSSQLYKAANVAAEGIEDLRLIAQRNEREVAKLENSNVESAKALDRAQKKAAGLQQTVNEQHRKLTVLHADLTLSQERVRTQNTEVNGFKATITRQTDEILILQTKNVGKGDQLVDAETVKSAMRRDAEDVTQYLKVVSSEVYDLSLANSSKLPHGARCTLNTIAKALDPGAPIGELDGSWDHNEDTLSRLAAAYPGLLGADDET